MVGVGKLGVLKGESLGGLAKKFYLREKMM